VRLGSNPALSADMGSTFSSPPLSLTCSAQLTPFDELILISGDSLNLAYIIAWLCRFVELVSADSMSYRNKQEMASKIALAMKLKTQYHHTLYVAIVDLSVISNFLASAVLADILVKVIISHPTK
jgi:hypothetical protein